MKEINIRIKVDGNSIETTMLRTGYDDSIHSTLEVIGAIQNLLNLELKKINKTMEANISGKGN